MRLLNAIRWWSSGKTDFTACNITQSGIFVDPKLWENKQNIPFSKKRLTFRFYIFCLTQNMHTLLNIYTNPGCPCSGIFVSYHLTVQYFVNVM